jgi:hypothetical protein
MRPGGLLVQFDAQARLAGHCRWASWLACRFAALSPSI